MEKEKDSIPRPSKIVRFQKEDFNPIVFGEKTVAIFCDNKDKKYDIFDGETFLGDFGDGAYILLRSVGSGIHYEFHYINDITAMEAGFANQKDMLKSFVKNDKNWKDADRAVIIRFEMVEQPDGTPVYFKR